MKKRYIIQSILGGQSAGAYFGKTGQFFASIGIDPELTVTSSNLGKPTGAIVPTRYETFSGAYDTVFTSAPMWIETTVKNDYVYSYLANGKLFRYSSSLGSETEIGTPTSGAGNGMKYYDNYIYLATPTNISRYGPLDGSPSITNTYWSSTLSKSVLINTTYPGFSSITYPNHAMHVHYGKLYFLDFKDGVGRVHFIQTTTTTVQGDTDNGSTENALRLPPGYYPFDIESYGSDLIIVCSPTNTASPSIKQGKAMLFFWDCSSSKPYRGIELPDSLGTALYTHYGVPYVWTGAIDRGVTLSRYLGGNQVEPYKSFPVGSPPPAGAIDALGGRISWGGKSPINSAACVFSLGYVNTGLPSDALNNTAVIPYTSTVISSFKYVTENSKYPIIGWRNGQAVNTYGLSKNSSTESFATNNAFYFETINVGQPFEVEKIRLPLGDSVTTNMTVVPTVYVDDFSSSTELDTINSTNFNGERNAVLNCNVQGKHNFNLGLFFSNTTVLPVLMPIEITINTLAD